MREIVLVKATAESEAGVLPSADLIVAMGKFNQELAEAGIMRGGDGIKPTSAGKRVAFDGEDRTVVDGPFPYVSELVAGYWLWEVKDMDEAVAWVKRCPNPMPDPSEIKIRPMYEVASQEPSPVCESYSFRNALAQSFCTLGQTITARGREKPSDQVTFAALEDRLYRVRRLDSLFLSLLNDHLEGPPVPISADDYAAWPPLGAVYSIPVIQPGVHVGLHLERA